MIEMNMQQLSEQGGSMTDKELLQIRAEWEVRDYRLSELCRAIEAKLKEKNNG